MVNSKMDAEIDPALWQVVLRQPSGKVVLFNPHSNQLSVLAFEEDEIYTNSQISNDEISHIFPSAQARTCPLCQHPLGPVPSRPSESTRPRQYPTPSQAINSLRALPPPEIDQIDQNQSQWVERPNQTIIDASYFRLLSRTSTPQPSRPVTPPSAVPGCSTSRFSPTSIQGSHRRASVFTIDAEEEDEPLGEAYRVDGYYERFFVEDAKLGRGERGSVFKCTHVLYGHPVGQFAVKKIAVGQSGPELLKVLKEVKFLERLRHQNITQYHHSWVELAQLGRIGLTPPIPVLFVLMDYANFGTLDAYIQARQGIKRCKSGSFGSHCSETDHDVNDAERRTREKAQFRRRRNAHQESAKRAEEVASNLSGNTGRSRATHSAPTATPRSLNASRLSQQQRVNVDDFDGMPIHLFGLEEILNIFRDTCSGLAFLHSQGILHHDLKTENVLLHWEDEDSMIPKALISDFGSSIAQSENHWRERTGRTGTLDWVPPESFKRDPRTGKLIEVTSKGDMWQLGLVLHCLCFFRLPYTESDDIDRLKEEIQHYPGYILPLLSKHPASVNIQPLNCPAPPAYRLDLPRSLLKLLADLLCLDPSLRPTCANVLKSIGTIRQTSLHSSNEPRGKSVPRSESDGKSSWCVSGRMDTRSGRASESDPKTDNSLSKLGQLAVMKRRSYLGIPASNFSDTASSETITVVDETCENGRTVSHCDEGAGVEVHTSSHPSMSCVETKLASVKRSPGTRGSSLPQVPESSASRSPRSPPNTLPKQIEWVRLWTLHEAQFRKQVFIGCLVIIKSTLIILSSSNASFDGSKQMLTLTVMNVLELILCSWRITAILTFSQMVILCSSVLKIYLPI